MRQSAELAKTTAPENTNNLLGTPNLGATPAVNANLAAGASAPQQVPGRPALLQEEGKNADVIKPQVEGASAAAAAGAANVIANQPLHFTYKQNAEERRQVQELLYHIFHQDFAATAEWPKESEETASLKKIKSILETLPPRLLLEKASYNESYSSTHVKKEFIVLKKWKSISPLQATFLSGNSIYSADKGVGSGLANLFLARIIKNNQLAPDEVTKLMTIARQQLQEILFRNTNAADQDTVIESLANAKIQLLMQEMPRLLRDTERSQLRIDKATKYLETARILLEKLLSQDKEKKDEVTQILEQDRQKLLDLLKGDPGKKAQAIKLLEEIGEKLQLLWDRNKENAFTDDEAFLFSLRKFTVTYENYMVSHAAFHFEKKSTQAAFSNSLNYVIARFHDLPESLHNSVHELPAASPFASSFLSDFQEKYQDRLEHLQQTLGSLKSLDSAVAFLNVKPKTKSPSILVFG